MHTIYGIYFENDKWYIGRTNDFQRRKYEHIQELNRPDHQHYAKVRAMHKYKYEFIILESNISEENVAEREQYWIAFYDSYNNGYNMTYGGEGFEKTSSEDHSQAKLTLNQVNEIKKLLKETDIKYQSLADQYNVSRATICNINIGKRWYQNDTVYPIRPTNYGSKGETNPQAKFNDKIVLEMRTYYITHTITEVCEKYNHIASNSAIKHILSGESYKHLPIYRKKQKTWINL